LEKFALKKVWIGKQEYTRNCVRWALLSRRCARVWKLSRQTWVPSLLLHLYKNSARCSKSSWLLTPNEHFTCPLWGNSWNDTQVFPRLPEKHQNPSVSSKVTQHTYQRQQHELGTTRKHSKPWERTSTAEEAQWSQYFIRSPHDCRFLRWTKKGPYKAIRTFESTWPSSQKLLNNNVLYLSQTNPSSSPSQESKNGNQKNPLSSSTHRDPHPSRLDPDSRACRLSKSPVVNYRLNKKIQPVITKTSSSSQSLLNLWGNPRFQLPESFLHTQKQANRGWHRLLLLLLLLLLSSFVLLIQKLPQTKQFRDL
jgi:hypothetical protein